MAGLSKERFQGMIWFTYELDICADFLIRAKASVEVCCVQQSHAWIYGCSQHLLALCQVNVLACSIESCMESAFIVILYAWRSNLNNQPSLDSFCRPYCAQDLNRFWPNKRILSAASVYMLQNQKMGGKYLVSSSYTRSPAEHKVDASTRSPQ